MTALVVELITKSLQLMHSLMPPGTKIGVLVNPANVPQTTAELTIVQDAARALGADVLILNASSPAEIKSVFATIASERVGALVVSGGKISFHPSASNGCTSNSARHVDNLRIPGVRPRWGSDVLWNAFYQAFRRVGVNSGRILKGEKAGDIAVEQVTKIELAMNLQAAKALDITIQPSLLARADEVIE